MKAYIEGYGCTLNQHDTNMTATFLKQNNFAISPLKEADYVIINTCAVKLPTEYRMLNRIRKLHKSCKGNGCRLIVSGCLPKINPQAISSISKDILQAGPELKELALLLKIPKSGLCPTVNGESSNRFVSTIVIARGCMGNCSFCCVRNARGNLKSYYLDEIDDKFKAVLGKTKEIWLTAQDTGCYGIDIKSSLPKLLERLLQNKGNYRIRIGMMNPNRFIELKDEIITILKDKRVYKFLHLPVQSGSDKILELMRRDYTATDFMDLVREVREKIRDITIATDVIIGFPSETEEDFQDTVKLLKETRPYITNISRYGKRPNTEALKLKDSVYPWEKKRRSRILSELCRSFSFAENKRLLGSIHEIIVSEEGSKGNFLGRTSSYKPVIIDKDLRGSFARVRIAEAFPTYLKGEIL